MSDPASPQPNPPQPNPPGGEYGQPYGQSYGQAPYPPQQPYGQAGRPPYPYGASAAPAPPRGMSIASFVLGLGAIVFGTFIIPQILAVVFGILGLRREPAGRGFALTGLILGGVTLIGWVIAIILVVIAFFGLVAAGTSGGVDYTYGTS